ncbi:MAG: arginyltransferase [Alphaproteobacteria bacterium]|nr:arginyltransferase [Alphaproteobacteria bacterium]
MRIAAPPLVLHRTLPAPCPYLKGRIEQRVVVSLEETPAGTFDRLSRTGFRRSHAFAYRPACRGCSACIPIRIPVATFAPDRTQRRLFRRNTDLVSEERPAIANREHFSLFKSYVVDRHSDGDMASMTFGDFRSMIEDAVEGTRTIEHRDASGRLVAVVLIDRLSDGLSAVYSFFDATQPRRSLGTHVVLDMIERSKAESLAYVYLGYWIADSRKMAYKIKFRPSEVMVAGSWRPFAEAVGGAGG